MMRAALLTEAFLVMARPPPALASHYLYARMTTKALDVNSRELMTLKLARL